MPLFPENSSNTRSWPENLSLPKTLCALGPKIVKNLEFPLPYFPKRDLKAKLKRDYPNQFCFRFLFSVIESPDDFFVLPFDENSDFCAMERLGDALDAFYGDAASSTTSLMVRLRGGGGGVSDSSASNPTRSDFVSSTRVGDAVVAKYRVDGRFYRGIVKGIRGRPTPLHDTPLHDTPLHDPLHDTPHQQNPEFFVFYFDYGNSDWVMADDVWPMVDQFSTMPPLCIRCKIGSKDRELWPAAEGLKAEKWTKGRVVVI